VIYDFPQYYNLFSRKTADAGIAQVSHTNRRFLNSYEGADGIKTGYTRAAGFNLVASAQRGQERIIATVFGGSSTAARNARITELMDMGFNRAPTRATIRRPNPPAASIAQTNELVQGNGTPTTNGGSGKTVRVSGLISRSLRPQMRPVAEAPLLLAVNEDIINSVVAEAIAAADTTTTDVPGTAPQARPDDLMNILTQVVASATAPAPHRRTSLGCEHRALRFPLCGGTRFAEGRTERDDIARRDASWCNVLAGSTRILWGCRAKVPTLPVAGYKRAARRAS